MSNRRRRCTSAFESLEARRLLHAAVDLSFNFAPKRVPGVEGMIPDVGQIYGDRGDGMTFGWQKDNTKNHRDRNRIADQGLDTLAMLQVNGGRKKWEIALPNGEYDVTVSAGDARYIDSVNHVNVEGLNVVKTTPSKRSPFNIKTRTITVADGKLTLRPGADAENAKVNWIRIRAADGHDDGGGVVVPATPTISVTAADATATEGTDDHGILRLTRDGDAADALTVSLEWSGAAGGADLSSPRPSSVTFAPGQTVIDLPVVAETDDLVEDDEAAWVTVLAGSGYAVGSASTANVLVKNTTVAPDPEPTTTLTNVTWATTSGPPSSFSEAMRAVVDGKMYLFGGFNGSFVPQSKVYRFDGTTWTTMNDAPVGFTHVAEAVVGSKVWFAGGYIGNGSGGQTFGTNAVRIYDTTNDTWTTGPALPAARASGSLALVGNTLYFFGGEDAGRANDVTTMWALDLDNQGAGWVTRASVPLARNHAGVVTVGSKIYALGGQTGFDGGSVTRDEIQIYDAAANTWSVATQKLPGGRSHQTSATFLYRDRILMIGGASAHNAATSDVWALDPATLQTSVFGAFPNARFSAAAGVLNDKIYAFGGYNGSIRTQAYVGTPTLTTT